MAVSIVQHEHRPPVSAITVAHRLVGFAVAGDVGGGVGERQHEHRGVEEPGEANAARRAGGNVTSQKRAV